MALRLLTIPFVLLVSSSAFFASALPVEGPGAAHYFDVNSDSPAIEAAAADMKFIFSQPVATRAARPAGGAPMQAVNPFKDNASTMLGADYRPMYDAFAAGDVAKFKKLSAALIAKLKMVHQKCNGERGEALLKDCGGALDDGRAIASQPDGKVKQALIKNYVAVNKL